MYTLRIPGPTPASPPLSLWSAKGAEGGGGVGWRQGTVEPRFNEPLYNEDLDITNHFLYPNNSKIYEK